MSRLSLLALLLWIAPMTNAARTDADRSANRLARESSPYLLQHAHNPVDWFPWGEEAFAEAQRRQVPIFLSIGYSTCYWCHVMERESFEDEATAALMNEHFVCIKVDREERPAVDDIYMAAVQLTTGRGGWPMSVFLTPPDAGGEDGLQPFYSGTYFPTQTRHGLPAFRDMLRGVADSWQQRQPAIRAFAGDLTERIGQHLASRSAPFAIGPEQAQTAVLQLLGIYDEKHGGFGGAPKFPQPVFLELLREALDSQHLKQHHDRISKILTRTLDAMALGGIHDQLGGGFHRYSTDAQWLVPHFEKMLYDNGQLALLYADSVKRTGDPYHADVLRRLCEYILREMTDPSGGFYSAQDAEVNHHEGENYLWREAEVRDLLEPRDADLFCRVYGLDDGPNFRDPHDPTVPPANVLFLKKRPEQLAEDLGMDAEALKGRMDYMRDRLMEARDRRDQPGLDDKIIAEWNGLMIAGMSRAGLALGEDRYIEAAQRAADFLASHLTDEDGALVRTCRLGAERDGDSPRLSGELSDYAAVIMGLLALYEAAGDPSTLGRAVLFADQAKQRFWDKELGGYFDTIERADLIVRPRTTYDGAIPSGASMMLGNLIVLAEQTRNVAYLNDAREVLASLSGAIEEGPLGAANSTRYMLRMLRRHPELVAQVADPALHPQAEPAVRIEVEPTSVALAPGASASLIVRISMDEGVHINANEPGDPALVPTELRVVGGEVISLKVAYPSPQSLGEGDQQAAVYAGEVEIEVTLSRAGEFDGEIRLVLTYQPCTATECLSPVHKVLDVRISPSNG